MLVPLAEGIGCWAPGAHIAARPQSASAFDVASPGRGGVPRTRGGQRERANRREAADGVEWQLGFQQLEA